MIPRPSMVDRDAVFFAEFKRLTGNDNRFDFVLWLADQRRYGERDEVLLNRLATRASA